MNRHFMRVTVNAFEDRNDIFIVSRILVNNNNWECLRRRNRSLRHTRLHWIHYLNRIDCTSCSLKLVCSLHPYTEQKYDPSYSQVDDWFASPAYSSRLTFSPNYEGAPPLLHNGIVHNGTIGPRVTQPQNRMQSDLRRFPLNGQST